MQDQIDPLLLVERLHEILPEIVCDGIAAGRHFRVALQKLRQQGGCARRGMLARDQPAYQVAHMGREAGIVEGIALGLDPEPPLHYLRAALDQAFRHLLALRIVGACRDGAVHDREGDADSLRTGKMHAEGALDPMDCHLADAVLGRIALLHIEGKRHLDDHMLFGAFDCKGDMVGKRDRQVRRELVGKSRTGKVCKLCREFEHIFGKLAHKSQVFGVDAVEGALDVGEWDLAGNRAEADAISERDELASLAIYADGSIVVDALDDAHGAPRQDGGYLLHCSGRPGSPHQLLADGAPRHRKKAMPRGRDAQDLEALRDAAPLSLSHIPQLLSACLFRGGVADRGLYIGNNEFCNLPKR